MANSFRICKVLSLPTAGLFTDSMYLVKVSADTFDCYVTDNAGHALKLAPGESAYSLAVRLGFVGTEAEWIASLTGSNGKSAYQTAVDNGFQGTEAEWLASLAYDPGYIPEDSDNKDDDNTLASTAPESYPTVRAVKGYVDTKAGQTLEQAGQAASEAAATAAAAAEQNAKTFAQTAANDAEVAAKAYADLILASAINLRGGYNAAGNTWPTAGGSGALGAIKAGNLWFVSAPGTLGGKPVVVGDSFFATTDNPGQTNANWCVLDTNLGFVPEEAGTAAALLAAHLLASDPHGDRAYAAALLSGHLSATDPHGDRAYAKSLASKAQKSGVFDDLFDYNESNSKAPSARLTSLSAAEITAANLNWFGGARIISGASIGGFYRTFVLGKMAGTQFTAQPSRGAIECCASVYVKLLNSSSGVYFGMLKDAVENLGESAKLLTFEYDPTSHANWRVRLPNGTFVDTGVAAALTTEFALRIKRGAGSYTAYINGTQVATASLADDDTTTVTAGFGFRHAGNGTNDVDIWADYVGIQQTLTTARQNFGFDA